MNNEIHWFCRIHDREESDWGSRNYPGRNKLSPGIGEPKLPLGRLS